MTTAAKPKRPAVRTSVLRKLVSDLSKDKDERVRAWAGRLVAETRRLRSPRVD